MTFEGLKQCIFQPSERVYVGTIPAAVDRVNKNKKANIDSLSVHRIIEPKNDGVSWFDFDISLNAGLVAVIGNKGSGKSAFSDIIGQVCKCRTMGSASFLNDNRFRKMPKNLASDYIAEIKWKDGHLERKGLDVNEFETVIEDNPNIAVACDAEQIICCKMDKNTHKITYLSGAIEDQEIKQNVVDILEGTMPAFDLRRRKYV